MLGKKNIIRYISLKSVLRALFHKSLFRLNVRNKIIFLLVRHIIRILLYHGLQSTLKNNCDSHCNETRNFVTLNNAPTDIVVFEKADFLLALHIWCLWTYREHKFLICDKVFARVAPRAGEYIIRYMRSIQAGAAFSSSRVAIPLFPYRVCGFDRGSDNQRWEKAAVEGPVEGRGVRAYSVKNVNKPWQCRRRANTIRSFCVVRTCRSHRRVLKPAGNKCKDNEGVARLNAAGIRPADKVPVFLAAWIQPRDTMR